MKHPSKLVPGAALVGLFTLVGSPGFAQGLTGWGPKAGLNVSNVSIDPAVAGCCDSKTGLAAGAFVGIGINDIVSIQPEFLFAIKGYKFSQGSNTLDFKVNLIEIPILVRANFMTAGQAKPFAVVGPSLAFKVGEAKAEVNGVSVPNVDANVESSDFSLIFGGGVKVRSATIEARYDLGLKNVDKTPGATGTVKTRAFTILFGFEVPR